MKQKLETREPNQRVRYTTRQNSCSRCGRQHGKENCPANGAKCQKYGKQNHFAIVCRSASPRLHDENKKSKETTHTLDIVTSNLEIDLERITRRMLGVHQERNQTETQTYYCYKRQNGLEDLVYPI